MTANGEDSQPVYTEPMNESVPSGSVEGRSTECVVGMLGSTVLSDSTYEESGTREVMVISGSTLHKMMKHDKKTIKILPILLGFTGLKKSKKFEALQQTMQLVEQVKDSFSSHHIIATGGYHLAAVNLGSDYYNFGFQSCKLASSKTRVIYDTESIESPFNDPRLNQHIRDLLIHLDNNKKLDNPLMSKLKKEAALIKVWNFSFGTNVLYFLRSYSGHLTNSRLWLFTDLEKTLSDQLHPVADSEDRFELLWYSKLDFVLRSMKISNGSTGEIRKRKPCRVFVSYDEKVTEDVRGKVEKLEIALRSSASKLGVTDLVKKRIIPFNTCTENKQRLSFHQCMRDLLTSDQSSVPLTWFFLRGTLESQSTDIFMKKLELCQMARECGIDDTNFKEFCKFFTSFGSLFDISLVCPQNDTIIIKPDVFLSKLSQAFDDSTRSDAYTKNGIITREVAVDILGPEGVQFMTVLSQVGMVSIIPRGKFGDGSNKECYYMPCARKVKQKCTPDPESVRLLVNMNIPPNIVNFEVLFTNYLLEVNEDVRLESSDYENMTVIKHREADTETIINITYRGDSVEIKVEKSANRLKVLKQIIQIVLKSAKNEFYYGQFTFAFAVICSTDKRYHILPEVCDGCGKSEYFQDWNTALALKEADIPEELKLTSDMKAEDVMLLAKEMELYPKEKLILFGKKLLNNSGELKYREYLNCNYLSEYVLLVLMNWLEGRNGSANKRSELAGLLRELGSESEDNRFNTLAGKLYYKVIQEKHDNLQRPIR